MSPWQFLANIEPHIDRHHSDHACTFVRAMTRAYYGADLPDPLLSVAARILADDPRPLVHEHASNGALRAVAYVPPRRPPTFLPL